MITIQTLTQVPSEEIRRCYNEAFSDYILPFELSAAAFDELTHTRRVDAALSVGAFVEKQLIGFILIGIGETPDTRVSYNSGTGVVPNHRRKRIISELYSTLLPLLQAHGIRRNVLEVITENKKAFDLYERLGYQIVRELHSFKGVIKRTGDRSRYRVVPMEHYDPLVLQSLWDWEPSWQHDMGAVARSGSSIVTFGVFDQHVLIGYVMVNTETKRVFQFAVKKEYRNRGVGTALFEHVAGMHPGETGVINVDGGDKATAFLLQKMGLTCFVKQYEMVLDIPVK